MSGIDSNCTAVPFVEAKGMSNQRHRQTSSKNTESSDDSQESEKESAQSDSLESSAPQPRRSVRNTTIDEESAVDHSDLTAGRPSTHSHPDGQNSSAAFAVAKPASKPPKSTRKSKRLNTGRFRLTTYHMLDSMAKYRYNRSTS